MKETQAVVQRAKQINNLYQQVELATDESLNQLKPGQSLLARPKSVRLQNAWHPYLREQWWPVSVGSQRITVELPLQRHLEPGDVIDLISPVGQPYRFRSQLHNVLLICHGRPPHPMLLIIPWLLANKVSVTLALLGTAVDYPTQHLPPEVEVVRGDDPDNPFAWQNQVTTIGWADQVFAMVSPADEMIFFGQLWRVFEERRADVSKNYLFGIFNGAVPCGVGACDACMVNTKDGERLACTDGPMFDLSLVKLP